MKIQFMREHGQGTVEYAFLIAIFAFAVIVVLALVYDASIQTAIAHFLTISDSQAADPSAVNTPNPWTDRIMAVAVPVTVVILIVYSFMHSDGLNHTPPDKAQRNK